MPEDDKENVDQNNEQENSEWSKLLDLKNEVAQAYIDKIKEWWFSFSWLIIWKWDMLKDYLVTEDIFDKIADEAKWKFLFQPFIKPLLSETIQYNWKTITIWEYLEQAKKELDSATTEAELNNLKSRIIDKLDVVNQEQTNIPKEKDVSGVTPKDEKNSWVPYKEAAIVAAWLIVGKEVVSALSKKDWKITSEYWVDRWDHKHGWIDYWADEGTSVYSMVEWTIDRVLYEDNWFGNYVVIKDKDWKEIIYAHLKEKPDLKSGQTIAMWEKIWEVGNTWHSTGPHLHLEVRDNWKSIDPKNIFPDEVLLV